MKTGSILLVEQEIDTAESLAELFATEGFSVKILHNLDVLFSKTSFSDYDLIIADTDNNCPINMELARRRGTGQIDTRLLLIACYCVMHKKSDYLRLGLDDIMAKPIDFDELTDTVKALLN
jgi:two-component system, OmpR family, response regulator TctD